MQKFFDYQQILDEFYTSRKAYQIILTIKQHLPDANPVPKIVVDENQQRISIRFENRPMQYPKWWEFYATELCWLRGETFSVHHTLIMSELRGKGMYELCADFRDMIALRFGAIRLVSTIRHDNIVMQKAATKNHWKQISKSGNTGLWLKELGG
jgi:hypothetical protein